MDRPIKDIAVIIPLEQELEAFFEVFPSIENFSTDDVFIHEVNSGVDGISMIVILQSDMGRTEAGVAAKEIFDRYDIGIITILGIAGSLSDDMSLGDVCYTGRIIDVYDNNKSVDVGDDRDGFDIEFSSTPYETSHRIIRSLNYARTQPDAKPCYDSWQERGRKLAEELCPEQVLNRQGILEQIGIPTTLNGAIVCGMVSKSNEYNNRLKSMDRKVLAIETESGAVFSEAKKQGIECLAIRGICDYADKNKGKLEDSTNGALRKLAAMNAASFLKMQLSNVYFRNQVEKCRPGHQSQLDFDASASPAIPEIDIIDQLSEIVIERLREYSPEYRFQPKGYRIPAPRVRRHEAYDTGNDEKYQQPVELRQALQIDRRIMLSVPRSYPDQSLPWVIAHDLLDAEIEGKQVVPLVIDGNRLAKPSRDLAKLADVALDRVIGRPGRHPVFIIENLPLGSPGKIKHLIEETLKYNDAHFIFISNSSPNVLSESDFKLDLSVSVYGLCSVSFLQIANFIERSFEMTLSESEVIAKRLWDTFDTFDLSAHPTYFAGIPRETLMALLHANRRAELIQLAVDGFLTIVVAADEADVPLSRTTRSRFLSDLAVDLRVELDSFDQSQLVKRVSVFATEQDFDIDPISFIKAFEDKGIINFDHGYVEFSLPFVEQYLLAKRLSENEPLAKRYFNIDLASFDPQVFDLYAELGPHDIIKQSVMKSVGNSFKDLSAISTGEHILLTNELRPRGMTSLGRIQNLQKKLSRTLEDIQSGKSNAAEKQRLLDLTDRIKETTARHARVGEQNADEDTDKKLDAAIKAFVLGVMLLGSGAEHLLAEDKRELSNNLVNLGALIVDVWTRRRASIDFISFKEEILSDESIDNIRKEQGIAVSKEELESMISNLIDMIEGAALSDPLRHTLGLLCEQARSKVLAKSLENIKPATDFGELLLAAWLTDVDPAKGKKTLKDTGASLPPVYFLRTCMAIHCLSRAFWHHWKVQDRNSLLDTAEAFLKPVSSSLNKAELKRRIERDKGEKKLRN